MLATKLTNDIKNLSDVIYETKFDGARIIAENNGSGLGGILWTRNGNHLNNVFPEIVVQLKQQDQCVLDCELVVFNDSNVSDFTKLLKRIHTDNPFLINTYLRSIPATLMVFDILQLRGELLINKTQLERKAILADTFKEFDYIKLTKYSYNPDDLLNTKNIEGIMVKQIDKPYVPGKRTDYWQKLKFNKEGVFNVIDYEQHPNGILMITSEGHRVNCNGRLSVKGKEMLDNGENFKIEVTYLEKTSSGDLRFPAFKRYVM